MKKLYILLTILFFSTLSFGQIFEGDIIITEIMQKPFSVDDINGEYFEIYNITNRNIDIKDLVISNLSNNSHTINLSVIVPANGYAVLGINSDTSLNGGYTANYQYSNFYLSNIKDAIILTYDGTIIDQVVYDGLEFPIPNGASMELDVGYFDNFSNDIGFYWYVAVSTFGIGDKGTPGSANSRTLSVTKNQIAGFAFYPNPVTDGKFNITSNGNTNKQVKIYSLLGKQVYSKSVKASETVEVSNLNKGFYILSVEEEGKLATRKFVIQ
jgi:hypothetical protein